MSECFFLNVTFPAGCVPSHPGYHFQRDYVFSPPEDLSIDERRIADVILRQGFHGFPFAV
jgi:hypothetical protein